MGDKARIVEDYYNVGRDVLDKEVEGKFNPSDIKYYDEEGKAIRENDKINYDETNISNERPNTQSQQLNNEKVTSWEFDNVKIKIVNNGSWSGKDILTIEIIEEIGAVLGRAIAGLINIFNPEVVVIGGSLSETKEYLMLPIKTSVQRHSLNMINKDTTIKFSKLGEKAGAIGACLLSRSKILGLI